MEIKQLLYFIEVAEREHMSDAAQQLNVAQSAVSRQIKNLEEELQVELFERVGRRVKLLPIGRLVLHQAKDIMAQLEQMKHQIADHSAPENGTIHVGFPTSLATTLLPRLIQSFSTDYPNIKFQLRQGSYQYLLESIKNRELNLAFIGPVIEEDPLIQGSVLFDEPLYLLVSKAHALSVKQSVPLSALKNEEFILFPKGYILEEVVSTACRSVGFEPKVSTEGEDMDAIKGMVAAGIGITLLPESAVTQYRSPFLTCIPVTDPDVTRTVGIITSRTRQLSPPEKLFHTFVLDQFSHAKKH
ncbi:GltC, transcription activator of glutamate synthase operon [Alkalibacterium sp. AK22]|uniref:LysR family transcriptional regulator n=1 Tax=Alkalibacterium sp. AK22 TaxID=1229520 RepID=UPI000445FCA9|nr:LysR family transcriptional regulator [Alkalibacterium sp. AK22]EXJ24445.1 GltC, transcription activator of glutamate synthase operon [Alkalibacterium sp. AK22]